MRFSEREHEEPEFPDGDVDLSNRFYLEPGVAADLHRKRICRDFEEFLLILQAKSKFVTKSVCVLLTGTVHTLLRCGSAAPMFSVKSSKISYSISSHFDSNTVSIDLLYSQFQTSELSICAYWLFFSAPSPIASPRSFSLWHLSYYLSQ